MKNGYSFWVQLSLFFVTSVAAVGQNGTVMFENRLLPEPPSRKVYDVHGNPLAGTNYVAQLYYGANPAALVASTTMPARFRPPNAPTNFYGTWTGGTRTLTGFPPGQTVYMQVKVWDTMAVSSYAEATEDTTGAQYGRSDVFTYVVPSSPQPPPTAYYIDNFRSFTLVTNPPNGVLVIRENGERIDLMMRGTHTIQGADSFPGPWNTLYIGDAPFTDQNSATLAARFYRINDGGVYSVNAVGYYRLNLCAGYTMIANQLHTPGGNALTNIFKSPPNDTQLFKYNGGGYGVMEFIDGLGWSGEDTSLALNPGEGAFIYSPGGLTHTFLGDVPRLASMPIPTGWSVLSSPVPQGAPFTDEPPSGLGFPVRDGDQVYQWRCAGGYIFKEYVAGVGWWGTGDGDTPVIKIGESFFFFRNPAAGSGVWNRNFSVGP